MSAAMICLHHRHLHRRRLSPRHCTLRNQPVRVLISVLFNPQDQHELTLHPRQVAVWDNPRDKQVLQSPRPTSTIAPHSIGGRIKHCFGGMCNAADMFVPVLSPNFGAFFNARFNLRQCPELTGAFTTGGYGGFYGCSAWLADNKGCNFTENINAIKNTNRR